MSIEQYDQMLREIGERVDAQIRVTQKHGAGLGDGEGGADDGEVHIREILRCAYASDIPVARDFLHRRAHNFGGRDLRPDQRQDVAGARWVEKHSAHAVQALLKGIQQRSWRVAVERRKRPVDAWQIGTDRAQDVWKVCLGGWGTSRCFPPRSDRCR
jgi:hypothetical protein